MKGRMNPEDLERKLNERYRDIDGTPISQEEWCCKLREEDYGRVALDEGVRGYRISTVWLGIDHNILGPKPLIFETMVFNESADKKADEIGLTCRRWSTYEEAYNGHHRIVTAIRLGIPLDDV